ncbi:hypothetical protein ACROYT_G036739 [Oculina patagonica]
MLAQEGSVVPSSVSLETNDLPSHETMSEGYDEYFDPPLESKYECPICLLGLREPVQTSCGHRFCRGCIVRSIRDGDSKCPVDAEHLTESQIYPDNFAKREMMAFEVFCRTTKQHGCTWKGPLHKLQDHLKECPFVLVSCTNLCGKQIQRKDLQQHMEKECNLRKIPCEYCQNDVLWNDTENHFETCSKYPEKCKKCEEEGIERDKMEFHLEQHCPNVTVECPVAGCIFEGLRHLRDGHINENLPNHVVVIANSVNSLTSAFSEMKVHKNEPQPQEQASQERYQKINLLSTRTERQRNEIDEMRHSITALTNAVHRLEQQIKESFARQERPLQEMSIRSLECERRFCNGTYIWRIDNYTQCREDAINEVMTTIYSPSFYTSPYGYKLCMRINLNGVGSGVGKSVTLYVHMVKGDYDHTLDWPFTGKFTLSILDQSDDVSSRLHISKTIDAEPHLEAFQRPTAPHNKRGFGYEEFASLEQICEPQYIKNNTLLVKFEMNH